MFEPLFAVVLCNVRETITDPNAMESSEHDNHTVCVCVQFCDHFTKKVADRAQALAFVNVIEQSNIRFEISGSGCLKGLVYISFA